MALRDDVIIRFGGDARGVDQTLGAIRTGIGGIGSMLAGLGVGFGLAGITDTIKETIGWADDLQNTANRVGQTTEAVQALRLAADHYGVSQQQVDDGLTKFAVNVGKAADGTGDLKDIFEKYHIALRNADGSQRAIGALFADYVGVLQRTTAEQERTRISAAGLGRGAVELGQAIAESGKSVGEIIDDMKALGLVMDNDGVKKLADLEQKWTTFTQQISVRTKEAVLSAVTDLQTLGTGFERLGIVLSHWASGEFIGVEQVLKWEAATKAALSNVSAAAKGATTGQGVQPGIGGPSADFKKYLADQVNATRSASELKLEIWKRYGEEANAIRKGDIEAANAAQKAQEDAFRSLSKMGESSASLKYYERLVGEIESKPIKMPFQMEILNPDGTWQQLAAGIAKGGAIPITVEVTPTLKPGDSLLWATGTEAQPNDLPREVDQTGANP